MKRRRNTARQLVEAVAEQDEELMEKYLEEGELTPEEIKNGIRNRHTGKRAGSGDLRHILPQ